MITTLTPAQARLIADVLGALQGIDTSQADGMYIRVQLKDELLSGVLGEFTEDEGAWLFEPTN